MKRFISAYSEIEQTWSSNDRRKPPSDLFPVVARVGSKERFEDFVNSLLLYFGKKDLPDLEDHERDKYIDDTDREDAPIRALFDISSDYTDMFYIAPMIGRSVFVNFFLLKFVYVVMLLLLLFFFFKLSSYCSYNYIYDMIWYDTLFLIIKTKHKGSILLARDKEKGGEIHIFKLENFESSWRTNITSVLGLEDLDDAILENNKPENYANAVLNEDALGTRLAALSFLGFHSDEAFNNLFYQKSGSGSGSGSSSSSSSSSSSNSNSNLNHSCSDDFFCYKNGKITMPATTVKQFADLRSRSR